MSPSDDEYDEALDERELAAEGQAAAPSEQPDAWGASEAAAAEVEADLEALRAERDEYLDTLRRLQADFENFRKRMQRDQTETVERATERLVEQLLPVLDSFELALSSLDDVEERVRKGVELVFAELLSVLERSGLERIQSDGASFDPNEHEAVLHEGGGAGEPVISETMRAGYRLKGRVLRPAMVKVSS